MFPSIVILSLVGVGSLAISLTILVPFAGALVRVRAHYNPKGLQLDSEGGVQPHTGLVITSLSAMLVRVYRIEGWPGLYKGLMPTLLPIPIIAALCLLVLLGDSNLRDGVYSVPSIGVLEKLVYTLFFMLISFPLMIIANRAITTPHKLPYLNASYSLRILLTPTERRRPWILYLTPGLLAAHVLQIVYAVGLGEVRRLLLPELSQAGLPPKGGVLLLNLAIYFVLAVASTAVLTPLDVIATRLAIQRNHAALQFNSVSQEEEGDAEETVEYPGTNEDVISLRTEEEPYTGLVDCAKKIIEEEGWRALYRAWLWMMLRLVST